MPQIYWSEPAKADYWENIDYLLKEWTEKEALEFINKVDSVLQIISVKPKTFQKVGYKNIHFMPVTPQIIIYYRILDKNTVELVRFWNTRQQLNKLDLL